MRVDTFSPRAYKRYKMSSGPAARPARAPAGLGLTARSISALLFFSLTLVLSVAAGLRGQAPSEAARAANRRGVELLQKGELEEAVTAFDEALKLTPDYPLALNNLGLTLAVQGQLDHALSNYQRALEYEPEFREAWSNLADALAADDQFDGAIAGYRKALTLPPYAVEDEDIASRPTDAEIYFNLGLVLVKADRHEEAQAALAEARRLDPKWTAPPTSESQQSSTPPAPPPATPPAPPAPTPAATTARPASARTSTPGDYAVQVGAFESRAVAEQLAQQLASRYPNNVVVAPLERNGTFLYRVRLLTATRGEAQALAARLRQEEHLKTWVLPNRSD